MAEALWDSSASTGESSQSAALLYTVINMHQFARSCDFRHILSGFYRYTAAFVPAFLASLCTIFIERKNRLVGRITLIYQLVSSSLVTDADCF